MAKKNIHIMNVLKGSNFKRIDLKLHKFLRKDMAAKLDIHSLEMVPKEEAKGAFELKQVPIALMIAKL